MELSSDLVDLDYTEQRDEHTMTQRAESLQEVTNVTDVTGFGGNDFMRLVIVYIYICLYKLNFSRILQMPFFLGQIPNVYVYVTCLLLYRVNVLDRLSGELLEEASAFSASYCKVPNDAGL